MRAQKTPSLVAAGMLLFALASSSAAQNSILWGERGEKWNPQSRLPDFSFAGLLKKERKSLEAALR